MSVVWWEGRAARIVAVECRSQQKAARSSKRRKIPTPRLKRYFCLLASPAMVLRSASRSLRSRRKWERPYFLAEAKVRRHGETQGQLAGCGGCSPQSRHAVLCGHIQLPSLWFRAQRESGAHPC